MSFRLWLVILVLLSVNMLASSLFAGGPFLVDPNKSGVAQRWQNNTATWYVDKGNLADSVDNAEAVQMIQEAMDKWVAASLDNSERKAVQTSSFQHRFKGVVSEDITASNIATYLDNDETRSFIIFDPDGSIVTSLGRPKESTIGLSMPLASTSSGLYITKGVVILSGYLIGTGEITIEDMKAVALHEIGHLIGLDHTQVNNDVGLSCYNTNSCSDGNYVPTMYPYMVTDQQKILKIDDIVTLSWIYPKGADSSQKFHPDFGTITGTINDKNGNILKGVNVIAVRNGEGDNMARIDARSMVSGVLYPEYSGDSRYYLYGLVPGHKYKVICEPIYSAFTGDSGLEPIDDPPSNFPDCEIQTPDGGLEVAAEAGKVFEMAAMTLNTTSSCPQSVCGSNGSSGSSSTGTGSKSCALLQGDDVFADIIIYMISVIGLIVVLKRRKFVKVKN